MQKYDLKIFLIAIKNIFNWYRKTNLENFWFSMLELTLCST